MELAEKHTGASLKRKPQKMLYMQVAEQIHGLIQNGDLAPDDRLLPERELAETFGVSRTSARNALAFLHGQGTIAVNPRDGAYVRKPSLEDALASLVAVLFQEKEQVAHLFEMRLIIETQAACLAAKRRTETDLQHLRILNRQFEADLKLGDMALQANTRFHIGIVETAKNPLLDAIMTTLLTATIEVYAKARKQSLSKTRDLSKFVNEHEAIIDAIQRQDPELAATVIAAHLNDARKRVEEIVENQLKKGA